MPKDALEYMNTERLIPKLCALYRDGPSAAREWLARDLPRSEGRRVLLEALELYRGQFASLLEIGCNRGIVGRLVKAAFGCTLSGLDIYPPSIQIARGLDRTADYRVLDVAELEGEYTPSQFDLILTSGTLMHLNQELCRDTCKNILALRPRLIVHQEIHGPEHIIEYYPDNSYFMCAHDYVGIYRALGCSNISISRDSRCAVRQYFDPMRGELPMTYFSYVLVFRP